jgi:DNA topoisomerase-1
LIKTLEQYGIGRPSTYAPIISTIQEREYVIKSSGSFKPTDLGLVVNDQVSQYFPNIVDIDFTARMEEELDEIATKKRNWVGVIKDFYTPFEKSLASATQLMDKVKLPDEVVDETCPKCGKQMLVKSGRFGKFIACSGYPECKTTKSFQIKTGAKCPECGSELVQRVSKKKRTFYGCSNYPQCTFATNLKPLSEPCPKCGSLMTVYRGKSTKCTKCTYHGKLPEA